MRGQHERPCILSTQADTDRPMLTARFMQSAIDLSRSSIDRPGTRPYAALIVRDGDIVGHGLNEVDAKCDPTAHGEIQAIRCACQHLKTTDLAGCELYATCEPCVMCAAAMYRARIEKLYFAIPFDRSAALLKSSTPKGDFALLDNDELATQLGKPVLERQVAAEQTMEEEAFVVLQEWWDHQSKGHEKK